MKKFFIILLVIFLGGCAPLNVKKGSKTLGKLNLGPQTQIEIEGAYSGNLVSSDKEGNSLGKINLGGKMRDLK